MSTSLKFPRPASLVLLVVGLATGWFAGRQAGGEARAGDPVGAHAGKAAGGVENGTPRDERSGPGKRAVSAAESQQFADSVRAIFRETLEERRMAMFESMLERAGPEHYAAVVALIRENDLRGSGSAGEWSRLWASWGRRDPAGAMEFIRAHDWNGWSREAPEEAKNRTLTYWAQTDPAGAAHFLETSAELANGDRTGIQGMVRGWAAVDAEAAAQWLFKSGLGMGAEYDAVVQAIGRKGGHEALDAWYEEIKHSEAPSKDLSGFGQTIFRNKLAYQPDMAAAWLEKNLDQPWIAEGGMAETAVGLLASRNPANAMEWAKRNGSEDAAFMAMGEWCERDVQAASKWLEENEDCPAYSQNAARVVVALQHRDPAAAREWVERIPDQEIRRQLLERLNGG